MLNRLTRAVKTAVRRRVHECGRTIKHMLRPVRTGAALVCAVSIDAVPAPLGACRRERAPPPADPRTPTRGAIAPTPPR